MKRRPARILEPGDLRRLELAVQRFRAGLAVFLRTHADQMDRLSQRMQVVVTESELLREALERTTGKGRMEDVVDTLERVTGKRS